MQSLRLAIASFPYEPAGAAERQEIMKSPIGRSAALVAATIVSLLVSAPTRAQSAQSAQGALTDERAVVATVTRFLDGIHTRDTSLIRSTVVAGATLVPVGGPTGLGAPSAIDGIIERAGKGTGPGNDERIDTPKVQIDDQLASLWAYFTLSGPGETKIDRCGVNLFLLRKAPDGWKIFQIAATSRTEGCRAIGT